MVTDVIVLKPAHRRPALRLPRPTLGRGGGASAPAVARVEREPNRAVEVVLTVGSILGALVAALTFLAAQSGMRPLVVRSGSMEPAISTGSMVLMRKVPASAIKQGDVVSVERPDRTRVTHRVLAVEHQGTTAVLTLKGDANEDPDPAPVTVTTAYRLVFSIDGIGRFTSWLATPAGGFGLGCLVTAVALVVLRRPAAFGTAAVPSAPAVRRVSI